MLVKVGKAEIKEDRVAEVDGIGGGGARLCQRPCDPGTNQ